tara:strand:- start:716 stop:892 length:177 start_codon:yes stop_codon:yes gene_type:complete
VLIIFPPLVLYDYNVNIINIIKQKGEVLTIILFPGSAKNIQASVFGGKEKKGKSSSNY